MTKKDTNLLNASCPIPMTDYSRIVLGHGSGGKLSQKLIETIFLPQFSNPFLDTLHDGAVLPVNGARVAFATDSYVVNPIFFPGGNIGDLAVNGTINDLAMCGATSSYLSAAFILEEGFEMEDLWKIVVSMQEAARNAGVQLVTGDTKVVEKGKCDKLFITTSGIGQIEPHIHIGPEFARAGDKIILNGSIADHGIAVLSRREGIEFDTEIVSDTAALHDLVRAMIQTSPDIHVLRDPTRGGVSSSLNEIARKSKLGIRIYEASIPIKEQVKGACEILGLDPLYVANEGKLLAFVPSGDARSVLQRMQMHPLGKDADIIGEVVENHPGYVVMQTTIGSTRIVDTLSGEQLPRIC
jgi:hydrogenase expression/formation protein HypE